MEQSHGAIIAGASSGVGEATGRALARLGMQVALIARRAERIERLAADIRASGGRAQAFPADLSSSREAEQAVQTSLAALGDVGVLVYSAGTNVPKRRLDALSVADWDAIVGTNLSGAFYSVRPVLPVMRARGRGLIVLISSVAGSRPSVLSGAAYGAAKAGLNALAACINLEEAERGIRACVIEPGDIDTELLDSRPQPPSEEQRTGMLRADDVAALVAHIVQQPRHVLLESVTIRPWTG